MEPEKKLMEMIDRAARMAKNHARMRMVWEDVRLGPEPDDPSRYISSLCCLREMAGR